MIRVATSNDTTVLLEQFERSLPATSFATVAVEKPIARGSINHCISSKFGAAFLYKEQEMAPPTGAIVGIADKLWYSKNGRCAVNLFLAYESQAGADELLRAFTGWAWSMKTVKEVRIVKSSDFEDINQQMVIFANAGLKRAGGMYVAHRSEAHGNCERRKAGC